MELLTREEFEGLTIWGDNINAQVQGDREDYIAIYVHDDVEIDSDRIFYVTPSDVKKLYAIVEEDEKR